VTVCLIADVPAAIQALAWFGDAMVHHAETFWSLFAVDMDALLEVQPSDSWDSFPLFQMLNNYLRTHGTCVCVSSLPRNSLSLRFNGPFPGEPGLKR